MKQILAILLLLLMPCLAKASSAPIISGISKNEIKIDSKFTGEKILLFGAKGDAGDIIIAVRGPKKKFIITQKEKFFCIWHSGKKVVVNDQDEIEVRSRMNITGSFDHRVADGAVGAKFVNAVKTYLENPTRLLQ